MSEELPLLEVRRLGRTTYAEAHAEQTRLLEARVAGEIGDQLLLTEHEEVVTLGRASKDELPGALGIPSVAVERGGEATWHGPGQLVAYPILALGEERRDLHRYLRDLEEVVIAVLGEFDVVGSRRAGLTGVWIGEQKVCSIGVAVRRWVTWHGVSLNVFNDLDVYQGFRPCGLDPEVMTRLADHADLPPSTLLVEVLLVKHFCAVFGRTLPPQPPFQEPRTPECGAFPQLPILPS